VVISLAQSFMVKQPVTGLIAAVNDTPGHQVYRLASAAHGPLRYMAGHLARSDHSVIQI